MNALRSDPTALTIDDLPLELFDIILAFTTPLEAVVCARVSRRWRAAVLARGSKSQGQRPVGFITLAVGANQWRLVEWARRHGCPWTDAAPRMAIESGRPDLFARLVALGCPMEPESCAVAAATQGDLSSLHLIINDRTLTRSMGQKALVAAAGAGHIDALGLLCRRDCACGAKECWARHLVLSPSLNRAPMDSNCGCRHLVSGSAASGGHVAMLTWLEQHGCHFTSHDVVCAASNGHNDVLEWLKDRGVPLGKRTCANAAYAGKTETLEWLRTHGCPWDKWTCTMAARGGHLDTLKWAIANGCPWDLEATNIAVYNGHLDVADWTLSQGRPLVADLRWDGVRYETWGFLTDEPARRGRIDVLEWLHARGFPADQRAFVRAAKGGHLDVVDWLHQHNPSLWNADLCCALAERGLLEALQHVRAKGCPWDETACIGAASHGRLDVIKWLRANGCPWDRESMCAIADVEKGPAMVQWLLAQGCPWNERVAIKVADSVYDPAFLAWIDRQGYSWDSTACLTQAGYAGNTKTVDWIKAHRAAARAAVWLLD